MKKLYDVNVAKINTLIRPDGRKKAYVRLTPDHDALDVANKVNTLPILTPVASLTDCGGIRRSALYNHIAALVEVRRRWEEGEGRVLDGSVPILTTCPYMCIVMLSKTFTSCDLCLRLKPLTYNAKLPNACRVWEVEHWMRTLLLEFIRSTKNPFLFTISQDMFILK